MSVIIKGMEMPGCCGDCPFQASRWTGDFCSAGQFMFGIDFDYRDKHPKCPLVPLPERHGKIIDGDALWENMTVEQSEAFQKGLAGTIELFEMLEAATPIVPAEGGNADAN